MSDRPILFTADEVRETLVGHMIRLLRPMRPQPEWDPEMNGGRWWIPGRRVTTIAWDRAAPIDWLVKNGYSPAGGPATQLWVRETWRPTDRGSVAGIEFRADDGWTPIAETQESAERWLAVRRDVEQYPTLTDPVWRPSTSMPRWASRLLLDVDAVRVQRLQEVTEEQAQAAGIPFHIDEELAKWEKDGRLWHGPTIGLRYTKGRHRTPSTTHYFTAREALEDWWNYRQPTERRWATNPWIWDITFKRFEQE